MIQKIASEDELYNHFIGDKMKSIFFVRHAEPDHSWIDDRSRPLTLEGKNDLENLKLHFRQKEIDLVFSSPYIRSFETVKPIADYFNLKIKTDERFRERKVGGKSNNHEMFEKRWNDLNFAEPNGETIKSVQKRNIEALHELLEINQNKKIVIGTHGTALSSILNYYDNTFGINDFLKILNLMPYVIRLDFKNKDLINKEEEFYIYKEFKKLT